MYFYCTQLFFAALTIFSSIRPTTAYSSISSAISSVHHTPAAAVPTGFSAEVASILSADFAAFESQVEAELSVKTTIVKHRHYPKPTITKPGRHSGTVLPLYDPHYTEHISASTLNQKTENSPAYTVAIVLILPSGSDPAPTSSSSQEHGSTVTKTLDSVHSQEPTFRGKSDSSQCKHGSNSRSATHAAHDKPKSASTSDSAQHKRDKLPAITPDPVESHVKAAGTPEATTQAAPVPSNLNEVLAVIINPKKHIYTLLDTNLTIAYGGPAVTLGGARITALRHGIRVNSELFTHTQGFTLPSSSAPASTTAAEAVPSATAPAPTLAVPAASNTAPNSVATTSRSTSEVKRLHVTAVETSSEAKITPTAQTATPTSGGSLRASSDGSALWAAFFVGGFGLLI